MADRGSYDGFDIWRLLLKCEWTPSWEDMLKKRLMIGIRSLHWRQL